MYSLLSANIFLLVWYVVGLLSMLFSLRSLGKRSGSNDDVVDPTRGLVGCNCYWWEFDTAQTRLELFQYLCLFTLSPATSLSPPNSSPAKSVETIQAPGSPFRSNDSVRVPQVAALSTSDSGAAFRQPRVSTCYIGCQSRIVRHLWVSQHPPPLTLALCL